MMVGTKDYFMRNIFFFCFLFAFNALAAQEETRVFLSASDVSLFIESYAPLNEQLRVLGESYSADLDAPLSAQAVNEEADAIFKRHGWGVHYMRKYNAVFSAFTYVAVEKQLEESPETLRVSMSSLLPEFMKATNGDDIELVRVRFSELNALIGSPRP
jgi:hypothetical protein